MLLSQKHRFLFVANSKTASTTVERILRGDANIVLTSPPQVKHMPYSEIERNFRFLFRGQDGLEKFFRFAVIRDPLDWIVSWYNYRSRPALQGDQRSTKGISFEEFVDGLLKSGKERPPFARIGFQKRVLSAADGTLGVDYLIPLNRLDNDLKIIREELGLKRKVGMDRVRANRSPKVITRDQISETVVERLCDHFAVDIALFRRAEEGGFGDLKTVIRSKLQK